MCQWFTEKYNKRWSMLKIETLRVRLKYLMEFKLSPIEDCIKLVSVMFVFEYNVLNKSI